MGFKDRIRIYSLLMEGLRVLRDIPQKNCRAVAYSHGGHLLAVASGFSLFVYTAITAQQVSLFYFFRRSLPNGFVLIFYTGNGGYGGCIFCCNSTNAFLQHHLC